jgi:excisionase family DNA binding protein
MPIELYTAEQVAALMGCSVKTVEAMARDGELPGIKPGGSWIFPVGALASQLDALALEQARARKAPKPPTATAQTVHGTHTQGRRRRALPILVDLRELPTRG